MCWFCMVNHSVTSACETQSQNIAHKIVRRIAMQVLVRHGITKQWHWLCIADAYLTVIPNSRIVLVVAIKVTTIEGKPFYALPDNKRWHTREQELWEQILYFSILLRNVHCLHIQLAIQKITGSVDFSFNKAKASYMFAGVQNVRNCQF